jgi:hypothetical protein
MKNTPETATPEALNPASAAANLARLKARFEESERTFNAAEEDYTRVCAELPSYLKRLMEIGNALLSIKSDASLAGDAGLADAAGKAFRILYAQEAANPRTIEWRAALSKLCKDSDAQDKSRDAYYAARDAAVSEEGGEQ